MLAVPTGAAGQLDNNASGKVESNVEKLRQAEEYVTCLEKHLLDVDDDIFGNVWIFELRNTCDRDRIVSWFCIGRPDLQREETIWSGGSATVECREEYEEEGDLRFHHRPPER